jgi:hypothetical protein
MVELGVVNRLVAIHVRKGNELSNSRLWKLKNIVSGMNHLQKMFQQFLLTAPAVKNAIGQTTRNI